VDHHGRNRGREPERRREQRLGDARRHHGEIGGVWLLFMMPQTVPNKPTKGAVAPMVASTPVPRRMRRA
jgi:hypothetical protein